MSFSPAMTRAKDLVDFECYETNPAGFIRDVLRADPWSRQIDIAESVRDNALTVVRSGNGVGKDWIAAQLSLWWVYARRGLVLLSGPTERQVREVCMGEVARAFAKAKSLPGELYQMALRLSGDETSGILAFTEDVVEHPTEYACVRCGQCLEACGNFLNPARLARLARADRWEELERNSVMDCMECGACTYACPSGVPIVHLIRAAKAGLRERKARET